MRKIFLSLFVILSFALYANYERQTMINSQGSGTTTSLPVTTPIQPANSLTPVAPIPSRRSIGRLFEDDEEEGGRVVAPVIKIPVPSTQVSTALYKDGTYTGSVSDAYYGNIQVKAVVQNGKLVDVIFLDYPKDRATSVRINTQAMPYLKSEAIAAQSAKVDVVSGASESSRAFNESLASALLQAKL